MVHDEEARVLRTVAARGFSAEGLLPVPVSDRDSVAARVFREERIIVCDPADPLLQNPGSQDERSYRGQAFLSIPISYAVPGRGIRCVGRHQPDRSAGGRFLHPRRGQAGLGGGQSDRRRDRECPAGLSGTSAASGCSGSWSWRTTSSSSCCPRRRCCQGEAEVAAVCRPVDSVGGDFYTFSRLGNGRVGVMLGDVSSHGFSAALVMALVLAAAGIHAHAGSSPDEVLAAMLESLGDELASTEMYLSVFYGVIDPARRDPDLRQRRPPARLPPPAQRRPRPAGQHRAAAGPRHRHAASRATPCRGPPRRTCSASGPTDWWTSAPADSPRNCCSRPSPPAGNSPLEAIVEGVFAEADTATANPVDDRTLLVMRV